MNIKVCVGDYETYKELVLLCCYLPHSNEKIAFEISKRRNDLYALVKFMREGDFEYSVSFNGISFDSQINQYIIDEHENWVDLSNLEICKKVYDFAQNIIDNQNYDLPPKYREKFLDNKQIDLFKILHYDNAARRCSLKWIEFSLDMDIETLPIWHGKEDLSEEDIDKIIEYCWKDISATYELYKTVIGDTELKDYKGKNKIQLRMDVISEFDLPQEAINWNDVKIGAELNKKFYKELSGKNDKQIWESKKNRKSKTNFTFGDCFPSYWKFETLIFQEFFKKLSKVKVDLNKKQEFKLKIGENTFTIAKGGSHTTDRHRIIKPEEDYCLYDIDVASMYPNAIRKRELFPSHLGKKWNEAYISNIPRRIAAKNRYKDTKDKKYDNLQETFKLSLNGNFGRLIDKYDWQYDPFVGMCITIGSQVDLMMLIEKIISVEGVKIKSCNTDGVTVMCRKDCSDKFRAAYKEWEVTVGNDILGTLEEVEYEFLVQNSVNDYLALKKGNEPIEDRLKYKGSWLIDYELHKNKSSKIIPIALKEYFVNNILPEETVKNHRNIFDFCIAKKASSSFYYEGIDRSTGKVDKYDKLIRYYVSTEGQKLYKVKKEGVQTRAAARAECEAEVPYQTIFNTIIKYENFENYKVDFDFYISETYKIISKILPDIGKKKFNEENGILTLF